MPIEHRVDREHGFVEIRMVGRICVEDVEEGFEARTRAPGYQPGMDLLLNCSDASVEIDRPGVQRILRFFEARRAVRGAGFRVALVNPSDLNFATARMYELLSGLDSGYPEETRVFREIEEARRWLGESQPPQAEQGAD